MKRNIFITTLVLIAVICFFSNFTDDDNGKPHAYNFTYPRMFGKPNLSADNPITDEGVWLGKLLFYDSILSINRTMSCATCHRQELSFTDGRPLAIGVHGDTLTRNTMALVNLAWSEYFFWDGRVKTMEEVIRQPISAEKEMGGLSEYQLTKRLKQHRYYPALFKKAFPDDTISMNTVSKAVAQFLYTIISSLPQTPEPVKERGGNILSTDGKKRSLSEMLKEENHEGLMARVICMQCKSCHTTELYGGKTMTIYENGVAFKTPTLTNANFTAPYMHDGRFKTAREVLQFYNDSTESLLEQNPQLIYERNDVRATVYFTKYDLEHADEALAEVEDTAVLTNRLYANPFHQKGFTWMGIKNAAQTK
jgi:cytochrome c peroxidase